MIPLSTTHEVNNLKELSEHRYSVRAYQDKEVEKEKIDYLLECARLAPSACNLQPWFFYVVTSDEVKQHILEVYPREWMKTAPMYIVVCGNHEQSWKRANTDGKDHCDVDVSIAAEHLCLAAHEIGLGTCWVCNFDAELLSQRMSLPEELEPVAIFPIGYIDTEKSVIPTKKRKPIDEITKWV